MTILSLLLLGPLVSMTTHIVLSRPLHRVAAPQAAAIFSIIIGYLPFLILINSGLFDIENKLGSAIVTLFYFVTAYVYFHFFNMSFTSRRIRLLLTMREQDSAITEDCGEWLYDSSEMAGARLDRLQKLGQIRQEDGRFFSTKFNFFAVIASALFAQSRIFGTPWAAVIRWTSHKR